MPTDLGSRRGRHDLVAWRRAQLLAGGFPLSLATTLAHDGRYDLHALIELVERHERSTRSRRAAEVLAGWERLAPRFSRVAPRGVDVADASESSA